MFNIENKIYNPYFYSVKVNVKCEHCDNEYKRIDNFPNSEKKTRKYFEDFYEDNEIAEIDECNNCGMYMFPEEIINITEHRLYKYLSNLGLYINDKERIVPTNSMQLVGITLEGVNEDNKCEAILMDLTEENYKKIWQRGKDLWDNGYISKYIICFMENDKCFRYSRPDKENFEICRKMDGFMKDDEALEIYNNNPHNDYFLIGDSLKKILKYYQVEETKLDVPTIERSNELEIN